ncbi:hypothetical protein LCGC14_0659240 [marine sediment metagenome]|uniref:Uncharacterized protein n=1 Tax=marine sediment metagenome TaxID=412755 RepID=A0A0F9U2F9_9ZZZZ
MGQDEMTKVAKDQPEAKNTKAAKPEKKKPSLWKRATRKTNLNHAKMSPEDMENLRIRVSMENHTRDVAQREKMIAIAVQESTEAFKQLLIRKYNMRSGKRYTFDLRTGAIDNEKSPPKTIPAPKPEQEPPAGAAPSTPEDAPAASADGDKGTSPTSPPDDEPVDGSTSNGEAA